MPAQDSDLTPSRILAVLRRRSPIVLICFVVAVGAALAYSLHQQKKYTATASLLFNNTPVSQQIAGLSGVVNGTSQSLQDTNTQLLKLGDLAQRTALEVGHGLTKADVAGSMTVTPSGDTTVVNVSSTLPSPTLAARVANTYANTFVTEQETGNHRYYAAALATVERQLANLTPAQLRGAQGLALQDRAQSLATLAGIRSGTVSLAQGAAIPSAASSPLVKRNVILAALLGLLLGVALAFGLERFDQSIRDPEELERTYGLPLLGVVPQSPSLRRAGRRVTPGAPPSVVADAFQFVRARLRYFNVDRDLRTLAVVSAQPGDGKTTIAHWLADAAASMGSRTLLIEADLRRPTMAQEVGLQAGPGLADILMGSFTFREATQTTDLVTAPQGTTTARSLDVIVSGALPPNPAEMLESNAMSDVIQLARGQYEFVVIDTPPLGAVSDALPLMSKVDGVAIVAGIGRNRRDTAQRLRDTLASVDAPVLGVIANRIKRRDGSRYGYGYGYGYETDSSKSASPAVGSLANGLDRPGKGVQTGRERRTTASTSVLNPESADPPHPGPPDRSQDLSDSMYGDSLASRGVVGRNGHAPSSDGNGRVSSDLNVTQASGTEEQTAGTSARPARRSVKERIIIYRIGSIGDTVTALPCFHLIEQAFPRSERIALTNIPESSKAAPLDAVLGDAGFIHGTIPYPVGLRSPRQLARLAKNLRNQNATALIYLAPCRGLGAAVRDVAFFRMCGFDNVIGAPVTDDLQTNQLDEDGNLERESHRLARTLLSLGSMDLSDRGWWDLRLTAAEHDAAMRELGVSDDRPFVAVNTGGKVAQKDWGFEAWDTLLRCLRERLVGRDLVFVGGREDAQRAAALAAGWPGAVVDLCGALSPRESAAALSRAELFIGHDSGPLHLADAVGTPAIGIFGDYNRPKMWYPSGECTRVVHRMSGISAISPDEVLAEISSLLARAPHATPLLP